MRNIFIAAAALIAAAPAAAQPPAYDPYAPAPALEPMEVERMARAMDRLVGAVMDLPIGGIADAVDPLGRSGYRRDDTVRDLATRDDPHAEARIRAGIRGSARGINAMSAAFARMLPALRASLDEIGRDVAAAMNDVDDYRAD